MLACDLDTLAGKSSENIKGLKVRSALNPGLWLVGVVCVPLLSCASYFKENLWIVVPLVTLSAIVVLAVLGIFVFFAIRHPERLQSEEYQLRSKAMQIYQKNAPRISTSESGLIAISGKVSD